MTLKRLSFQLVLYREINLVKFFLLTFKKFIYKSEYSF